jgi:hypothetical protein
MGLHFYLNTYLVIWVVSYLGNMTDSPEPHRVSDLKMSHLCC